MEQCFNIYMWKKKYTYINEATEISQEMIFKNKETLKNEYIHKTEEINLFKLVKTLFQNKCFKWSESYTNCIRTVCEWTLAIRCSKLPPSVCTVHELRGFYFSLNSSFTYWETKAHYTEELNIKLVISNLPLSPEAL